MRLLHKHQYKRMKKQFWKGIIGFFIVILLVLSIVKVSFYLISFWNMESSVSVISSSSSNNNAAEATTVIGVAPLSGMDVDFDLEEKESDVFMPRKPTRVTFGAMIDSEHDTYDNMYHYNDDSDDNSDDDSDDDDNNNYEKSPDSKINRTKKKRHGRSVTHGLADFVAQEEMDRYRGFWWDEKSNGILFVRVDDSCVPQYRIAYQGRDGVAGGESNY
mmetsp:Transcript_20846/g.24141  ORF Transcript_20846/g.24141 Transcript_20846/m.24141 type:complete len:217 (-) Transcript_20846:11-661(-)